MLARKPLEDLVKKYRIVHPFREDLLDVEGYLLTAREGALIPYQRRKNLITREIVFVPPKYVGVLSTKSSAARKGLFHSVSIKVHAGFCGRLVLEFFNAGGKLKIEEGEPLVSLDLLVLVGNAQPYRGTHQFQYMTREEVEEVVPFMRRAWEDFGLDWKRYESWIDEFLEGKNRETRK